MILPAQAAQSLPNYCVRIPEDWDGAGKSLGALKFWRATGATVVAIRRSGQEIVSPDRTPHCGVEIFLIFVGDLEARKGRRPVLSLTQSGGSPAGGVSLPIPSEKQRDFTMVHNEIHTIDLLIIAAYLIAMVLIGLVVVRKVRNMDDYYLGGRSFGPLWC